jgi:hypothetical protein
MNRLLDVQMLARRAQDQIDGALRLAVHLRQVKGQEAQRQVSGEQPKKKECPTLILAALNAHHQYDGTGILNREPIGVRELAVLAGCSAATVTRWFNSHFMGHKHYKACCSAGRTLHYLKTLNGDYSPHAIRLIEVDDDEVS